jgi:hypothetical protein
MVAYTPGTAARGGGSRVASAKAIGIWGAEQLKRIAASPLTREQRLGAVANLCSVGVDIKDYALLRSESQILSIPEIVERVGDAASIFVCLEKDHFSRDWELSTYAFGLEKFHDEDLVETPHLLRLGGSGTTRGRQYDRIRGTFPAPTELNSAYGVLLAALKEAGYTLEFTSPAHTIIGKYAGPDGGRGRLMDREFKTGAEIKYFGLVINATRYR